MSVRYYRGKFMEYIREKFTTVDNTFEENEINLNVYRRADNVLALREILIEVNTFPGTTTLDKINWSLSTNSRATVGTIGDSGVLAAGHILFAGAIAAGCILLEQPFRQEFKPPVMVAKQKLYLQIETDDATIFSIALGYTMERVGRRAIVEALTE